jgi:uncharacterized membrane protein
MADDSPAPQTPGPVVRAARVLSVIGLLALITLGLAWELWLAPTGSGTLALKVLPLVFCLLGLLRHRMYTYRWLSLLIWLYFMEGAVRATSEKGLGAVLATLEVVLSLLLFAVATLYIRQRQRSVAPVPAKA